jgi:hypothetical protein
VTPLEALKAARAKIEKPENWTKCTFARDRCGIPVSSISGYAVCWCSGGAVLSATKSGPIQAAVIAMNYLDYVTDGNFVSFNDAPKRKHEEVLAAFDKAIALAEEPKHDPT